MGPYPNIICKLNKSTVHYATSTPLDNYIMSAIFGDSTTLYYIIICMSTSFGDCTFIVEFFLCSGEIVVHACQCTCSERDIDRERQRAVIHMYSRCLVGPYPNTRSPLYICNQYITLQLHNVPNFW